MELAVITSADETGTLIEIDRLQFEQFEHDETYHREITRLPLQQRLRHMALHFAKYSGNLAEAQAREDESEVRRIVIDVLIIGMSSANALNFRLSSDLGHRIPTKFATGLPQFTAAIAIGAGRMAAASEKLDHMEDFPFRPTMRTAVTELVLSAISYASERKWHVPLLVRERLRTIKEKFIYHNQV